MITLGFFFCILIAEGLIVKHVAFLFLHASVFESLRWAINRRMRESRGFSRWVFQKLSELFSCNLCMVTQVSLWLHLFTLVFARIFIWDYLISTINPLDIFSSPATAIVIFVFWFGWSMAIAASGMFVWELTGLPVVRAHEIERHKKEIENITARRIAIENGWIPPQLKDLPITFLDFFYMITIVEWDTTGIGCRGLKGIMRGEEITSICQQWAHEKGLKWEEIKMDILPLVQKAAKHYFAGLKWVPESRLKHLQESWNKAQQEFSKNKRKGGILNENKIFDSESCSL